MRLVDLPVPSDDITNLIHRFPGFEVSETAVMLEHGTPSNPLPEGFSVRIHQLKRNSLPRRIEADRMAVWLVTRGKVQVHRRGMNEVLGPLDAMVIEPGLDITLTAPDTAEVVEIIHAFTVPPTTAIARFARCPPIRTRPIMRIVPTGFREQLSPRDLHLMVGPTGARVPYGANGPHDLVITLARCAADSGPALHVHRHGVEVFTVLEGRFQITWGDAGQYHALLHRYDTVAFPVGVNRTFTAVDDNSLMLPIVTGASDELEDIVWLPEVARQLKRHVAPWCVELAGSTLLTFGQRRPLPLLTDSATLQAAPTTNPHPMPPIAPPRPPAAPAGARPS